MKWWAVLGIIVAVIVAFGGTFALGQQYNERAWVAANAKTFAQSVLDNASYQAEIAELKSAADQDVSLIDEQRSKLSALEEHLNEAQRENSACNMLRGAVSMLNESRGYEPGTPENRSLSADQSREASTITERDLIREANECELDFRELTVRHNVLVEAGIRLNEKADKINKLIKESL